MSSPPLGSLAPETSQAVPPVLPAPPQPPDVAENGSPSPPPSSATPPLPSLPSPPSPIVVVVLPPRNNAPIVTTPPPLPVVSTPAPSPQATSTPPLNSPLPPTPPTPLPTPPNASLPPITPPSPPQIPSPPPTTTKETPSSPPTTTKALPPTASERPNPKPKPLQLQQPPPPPPPPPPQTSLQIPFTTLSPPTRPRYQPAPALPPPSPGTFQEISPLLSPPPLISGSLTAASSKQSHISPGLIVGCLVGVFALLLFFIGYLFIFDKYRRRRTTASEEVYYNQNCLAQKDESKSVASQHCQRNKPQSIEHVITLDNKTYPLQDPCISNVESAITGALGLSSLSFSYEDLVAGTNGFSEANLLGQGGFGYVYKGLLPGGKEVAVKQLKEGSRQGEREFQAEVDIISRVHHKHLVSLVGCCIHHDERLLVYEFVPNNTLEFHLHENVQAVIGWTTRMKIAIGSAKGLAYLHEDCNPPIIHRDIKSANILLDHKFDAKLSDFGLARSFKDGVTHVSTQVVGTFGYLAPEYASSGTVTEKSDVYSFGVILLELITGHPAISTSDSVISKGLVEWARPLLARALEDGDFNNLVDPRLMKNYDNHEMAGMVACASACVRHSAHLRPRMAQMVRVLEGDSYVQNLDQGLTPGNSTLYDSSSDHVKKLSMAFTNHQQYGFSGCDRTTSEYGINPSNSTCDIPMQII